ncbi:hypothetical protein GCM10028895_25790 [Pontibacter rugosus]
MASADWALSHYVPSVQFIKYDENGNKVNKRVWDDFMLNPKELLNEIITGIPDWKESIKSRTASSARPFQTITWR